MHYGALPDDVLQVILCHVPVRTLSTVSKRVHRFVSAFRIQERWRSFRRRHPIAPRPISDGPPRDVLFRLPHLPYRRGVLCAHPLVRQSVVVDCRRNLILFLPNDRIRVRWGGAVSRP